MAWRDEIKELYRDFVTDGVASSGPYHPEKPEIRRVLGERLQELIASAGAAISRYKTAADRDAVTDADDGQLAYVYFNNNDAADPANGYFQWDAAAGDWIEAEWLNALTTDAIETIDAALAFRITNFGRVSKAVADGNGNALMIVNRDTVLHPELDRREEAQRIAAHQAYVARLPKSNLASPLGDVLHMLVYGQSNAVRLVTGVDPWREAAKNTILSFTDSPAWTSTASRDATTLDTAARQTGIAAGAQMVLQLLREEDGVELADLGERLFLSSPATSGVAIANLRDGVANFKKIDDDVSNAERVISDAGGAYDCPLALFVQGEADNSAGTTKAAYLAHLVALQAEIEAQIAESTGIERSVPMLLAQTTTHPADGVPPEVALAQLEAVTENAQFGWICPMYFLPYGDEYHLPYSDFGGIHMGAYAGLAFKRWVFDRVKPEPLIITKAVHRGTDAIVAQINVKPGRKLVADTLTVAEQPNLGFRVMQADGVTPRTVTSARVAGRNAVELTGEDFASGDIVQYGFTNAIAFTAGNNGNTSLGNIRDDSPMVFRPDALRLPMWDWLAICEKEVS